MKAHKTRRVRLLLLVALTALTLGMAHIGALQQGMAAATGAPGLSLLADGGGPGTGG